MKVVSRAGHKIVISLLVTVIRYLLFIIRNLLFNIRNALLVTKNHVLESNDVPSNGLVLCN
jgi:hypothetical protein